MKEQSALHGFFPPQMFSRPATTMSDRDDPSLLRSYVEEHSQAAFAEFVRRHVDLVYHTALRRLGGDAHLAEDVAQQVFSDLARKAASLGERTALAGWLYRSTRFAAAQTVRTEQRRRNREQEAYTLNELHATGRTDWERIRPIIDDAMNDLNDADREAVLLRFFEGRPLAEVGARLAVSADAARMRIERALEKLRARLARRGVDSTAAALTTALASQAGVGAPVGLGAKIVTVVFDASGAASGLTVGLVKTTLGLGHVLAGGAAAIVGLGALWFGIKSAPPVPVALVPDSGSALISRPNAAPLRRGEAAQPAIAPPRIRVGNNAGGRRSDLNVDGALRRLDRLVHLTPAQETEAGKVFSEEQAALDAYPSLEDQLAQGRDVRQHARTAIRALLAPAQQRIYDEAPQRLGGGSTQDAGVKAARIDSVVALTPAQTEQVAAIVQHEVDALQELSPGDRGGDRSASIRETSKAAVRALLSPEQQEKYDANPNGAPDLEARAYVDAQIKNSPAVIARLGSIVRMTAAHRSVSTAMVNEQIWSMKGTYRYNAQGRTGTEVLSVDWEKTSPTAPIRIVRIEGNAGEVISP